ncbi:MAG: glycosyltransferase [Phycisphaerales bacterium JB065]
MTGSSLAMVAYYFPPDGGAGAQRPLKFAKYLSRAGKRVTVVTHPGQPEQSWTRPADRSLEAELSAEVTGEVVRVEAGSGAPRNPIDGAAAWSLATAAAVSDLVKQGRADAVLYTMSPFSLVRSAERVREAHPDTPIILDFRDPWALDGWQPQRSWWHWKRQFSCMKTAVEAADGVIANTPECGRLFQKHFPDLDPARLAVITNGFDRDDFRGDPGVPSLWELDEGSDLIRLAFSGSLCTRVMQFYEGPKGRLKRILGYSPEKIDYSGRTLIHLMEAINRLRRAGDPLADRIMIEVVGVEDESDRRSVERAGLTDQVRFHGYVPHDEAVRHIRLADALLLPLHGLPPGKRSRIVPGKTYEYLATGRPILGLLPEGDARDFVKSSERGAIADPCDPDEIAQALRALPGLIAQYPVGCAPAESVQCFERELLAGKLAEFVAHISAMNTDEAGRRGSE